MVDGGGGRVLNVDVAPHSSGVEPFGQQPPSTQKVPAWQKVPSEQQMFPSPGLKQWGKLTQVTNPGPQDLSHVNGAGTGLQRCTICRSKSSDPTMLDTYCPVEVAATAEAELMRMIACKTCILVVCSIDKIELNDIGINIF